MLHFFTAFYSFFFEQRSTPNNSLWPKWGNLNSENAHRQALMTLKTHVEGHLYEMHIAQYEYMWRSLLFDQYQRR